MKLTSLLLAIAITTTTTKAVAVVITDMRSTEGVAVTWAQDSSEGFNLSLSGTGIPFDRTESVVLANGALASISFYEWHPLGDAFRSPSGQWIIQPSLGVQVFRNAGGLFTGLTYEIFGNVWNTGLVDGFLLYDPFDAGFVRPHYSELTTEKYQSGDIFASWTVAMATDFYADPLDNPATWAWTLNISAHAPVTGVPDNGSTLALFGFAVCAIGVLGRRVRA